jgi:hypothetical protein
VPISRKQLPESAEVLQQMVLDLIARLEAEQARRIKTENLLSAVTRGPKRTPQRADFRRATGAV